MMGRMRRMQRRAQRLWQSGQSREDGTAAIIAASSSTWIICSSWA